MISASAVAFDMNKYSPQRGKLGIQRGWRALVEALLIQQYTQHVRFTDTWDTVVTYTR